MDTPASLGSEKRGDRIALIHPTHLHYLRRRGVTSTHEVIVSPNLAAALVHEAESGRNLRVVIIDGEGVPHLRAWARDRGGNIIDALPGHEHNERCINLTSDHSAAEVQAALQSSGVTRLLVAGVSCVVVHVGPSTTR